MNAVKRDKIIQNDDERKKQQNYNRLVQDPTVMGGYGLQTSYHLW